MLDISRSRRDLAASSERLESQKRSQSYLGKSYNAHSNVQLHYQRILAYCFVLQRIKECAFHLHCSLVLAGLSY